MQLKSSKSNQDLKHRDVAIGNEVRVNEEKEMKKTVTATPHSGSPLRLGTYSDVVLIQANVSTFSSFHLGKCPGWIPLHQFLNST